MKRILGLILVSMMLMTMILPVSADAKAIPSVSTELYGFDLSSDYIEIIRKTAISGDTLVMTEEGAFLEGEDQTSHRAEANVYPMGKNGAAITDNVVVDFTWRKSSADDAIDAYLTGSDNKVVRVMSYKATSGFYVGRTVAGQTAGETGAYDIGGTEFGMDSNVIRVTLSLDFAADSFDLWINGEYAATYGDMAMNDLSSISFNTYGHNSRSSNITVEDLSVYKPVVNTAVSLDKVTRETLTQSIADDATFLGEKLNLNFPGVTFASSDSAVINPTTGVVTRPQQTKNVTVTATAGAETKDFAFRIPGLFDNTPVESVVYFDDFEDGVLDSRIERGATSNFTDATIEANGNLQCQRTPGSGNALTSLIWLKPDKTMVNGDLHLDFKVARDFVQDSGFRVYLYGLKSDGNRAKAVEIDITNGNVTDWNTTVWIATGATYGATADTNTIVTVNSPNSYRIVADVDGETGIFTISINGTPITLTGGYLLNSFKGLAAIGIMPICDTTDPWVEYFSCTLPKEASPEEVIYYDDFEDGVLDPRIVKAGYSQETMEANGKLNFKSTGTGGDLGSDSHATGKVYFKEDQTAVDGKFKVEFELKRDAFVYGKTRIYFTGSDGYCHYIDWCGGVPNADYSAWTTQIRLTTNGAAADDVLNTSAYEYVGTLKVEALIDNDAGTMELTLNGEKFNMNYCGEVSGRKVSCISISEYHTSADIVMNYINCIKEIEKEAVTATSMDYNAFDKKVTIVSPAAQDAVVVAAAYTGTGAEAKLVNALPVPATLVADGSVTVDLSAFDAKGATDVKLYLWNSETGLQPLAAPALIDSLTAN